VNIYEERLVGVEDVEMMDMVVLGLEASQHLILTSKIYMIRLVY